MVHAQFLEAYTHFTLMYMAYHIFPVLPIKDLINEDGGLTMPFKLATDMKPSISKRIVHVLYIKLLHMLGKRRQTCVTNPKIVFGVSFLGFRSIRKGIFFMNHTNIISYLCMIFFNESFSIFLAYKSQPYAEAMDVQPAVSNIPYATCSKEKTGNIITFTYFEEGGLQSETRNDTGER